MMGASLPSSAVVGSGVGELAGVAVGTGVGFSVGVVVASGVGTFAGSGVAAAMGLRASVLVGSGADAPPVQAIMAARVIRSRAAMESRGFGIVGCPSALRVRPPILPGASFLAPDRVLPQGLEEFVICSPPVCPRGADFLLFRPSTM